ncbi:MAG: hypothetical protein JSU81_00645 [Candidatus Coatesbacteria bacterium]|nr:MAG: hypothetical protein JSU81_00645 [Candidatus Coatesbacteria bacterium]
MARLNTYLLFTLIFLIALAVAIVAMPAAGPWRPTTIAGALTAAAAVASFFVIRAFRAARHQPALRPTWVLFSLGALLWFAAEALTLYHLLARGVAAAYPVYADYLWGAGAACIIASLIVKIAQRPPRVSPQALAGALATAAVALLLAANFVILPALRNPALSPADRAAEVFIAVADLALGALALVVIAIHGGHGMGRPWAQLALGLVFYAAGEAIHWHLVQAGLYGPAGNLVTALAWTAGYLLIGMGAYYRRLVLKGVIPLEAPAAEPPGGGG